MQRTISHTFVTVLLTVSYLWGGCISCEQFFTRPASKGDCCKARRCNQSPGKPVDASDSRSAPEDCQAMPVERYQGTGTQTEIGADWYRMPAIARVDQFVPSFTHVAPVSTGVISGSPPDPRILSASLLI